MSMSLWNCHGYCCIFFSDESQREMLPFHFLSLSFLSPEWAVGSEQIEKDTLDLFSFQSASPTAFQFLYPFSPTCVGGGRGDRMKLWTTQLSPTSCVSSCSTFSPCLPFVPLSSPGVNVLFPTILTLSHLPCYYGNLGNIIILAQKEISILPAESCSRTDSLLSNFHMFYCNRL